MKYETGYYFDTIINKHNLSSNVKPYAIKLIKKLNKICPRYKQIFINHEIFENVIIFISCKLLEYNTLLSEFVSFNIPKKQFYKYYKLLINKLEIKDKIKIINPINLAPKIMNDLNLTEKIKAKIIFVIKQVKDQNLMSGKTPLVIVSSCIYAVCKLADKKHISSKSNSDIKTTQTDICKISNVTEVSIRNSYQEAYKILNCEEIQNGK